MEIYLLTRCRDSSGIAGGHERVQIATASLDQRLNPDLQKTAAQNLAERIADTDQGGGDRASCFQFRLLAARISLRLVASFSRRPAIRLGPNHPDRYSHFPYRFGLSRRLLHLRATRTASAHLDARDFASALPPGTRDRAFF